MTKIADVNALLKALNVAEDYKGFPLLSAEKNKKQTVFTLVPQVGGKPEYTVLSPNELSLNPTTNKLTLTPETGELIVNYSKDHNRYEFSYKAEPKNTLRISYKVGNLTSAEADPKNWTTPEIIDFNTTKLFEFLPNTPLYEADALLEANISTLKDAEKAKMKAFKDFMFNLWKTEDNQNINDTETQISLPYVNLLKNTTINYSSPKTLDAILMLNSS